MRQTWKNNKFSKTLHLVDAWESSKKFIDVFTKKLKNRTRGKGGFGFLSFSSIVALSLKMLTHARNIRNGSIIYANLFY